MHFIRTTHLNSFLSSNSYFIPQWTVILRLLWHNVPFSKEYKNIYYIYISKKWGSALARTVAATSGEWVFNVYVKTINSGNQYANGPRVCPTSLPPPPSVLFGHITMPFECHKQNIKCCAYLSNERVNEWTNVRMNEWTRRRCQCTIHI